MFQMVYYMFIFDYQMIEIWQKQYSKLCKRSFDSLYSILFLSILFHRTIFSRFLHGFLFNIWHIIYHWKALIFLFLMRLLSKWNSYIFSTFSKISYPSPVQLVLFKILDHSRQCKISNSTYCITQDRQSGIVFCHSWPTPIFLYMVSQDYIIRP